MGFLCRFSLPDTEAETLSRVEDLKRCFDAELVEGDLYGRVPAGTANPVQMIDKMAQQTAAAIPGSVFACITFHSTIR